MKKVKLSLVDLSSVIEDRTFKENNKIKNIKENVNYVFKDEGINFSCELNLDSKGELGITKINGLEPVNEKCFVCIEDIYDNRFDIIYDYFVLNHGFLPSTKNLDLLPSNVILSDMLEFKVLQFCLKNENMYFLGVSKEAKELFNNEREYFYDRVKIVPFEDIVFVGLDIVNKTNYLNIYTKDNRYLVQNVFLSDSDMNKISDLQYKIQYSLIK